MNTNSVVQAMASRCQFHKLTVLISITHFAPEQLTNHTGLHLWTLEPEKLKWSQRRVGHGHRALMKSAFLSEDIQIVTTHSLLRLDLVLFLPAYWAIFRQFLHY
jgi:hypothetical protein